MEENWRNIDLFLPVCFDPRKEEENRASKKERGKIKAKKYI